MKKHLHLLFLLLFPFLLSAQETDIPGTYQNPLNSNAYMGDPFMIFHDGTYYLYGTNASGEGFKCWSSVDLNSWKNEGFIYRKRNDSWGNSNFWAPEVYYHNDRFYLAYSSKSRDTAINRMLLCLAVSDSPTGPFRDLYAPWFDYGFSCIDAHIFFDDNGKNYLYFDRVGYEGKWPEGYLYGYIYCMTLDSAFVPSGDTIFCSGPEQEWENPESMRSRCNEGCFVQRYNGKYYMTYSANHYADPYYGIGYSTADSPLGPWTKDPDNPLVGMDPGKGIYGPGHNCFLHSPDGKELFIVYHTHVSETDKRRQANMDRVHFDDAGKLVFDGPTRSPQRLPSGM